MEEESCSWYDPTCSLAWIGEELRSWALWLYDSVLQGFSSLINYLPVPDFMINMGQLELPASVSWFVAPFQLEWGLALFATAYTARFVVRRIPVIG